ncbi:hypothetical protein BZA77DRAFT_354294 [Pyronema omphalodes]|nr:hypothetical protein BZA77DRAFT_362886 [Pyronema omphalodes]KAI5816127.1 hypothetical protein BZA77DRAFT_354294 [Pyronema omphalodes]
MDPADSPNHPRYLHYPIRSPENKTRGHNNDSGSFKVGSAPQSRIPVPWLQSPRTRSETVSAPTQERVINTNIQFLQQQPEHSPRSQLRYENPTTDHLQQEKVVKKKKSTSGIKNVWQIFRSPKSESKIRKDGVTVMREGEEQQQQQQQQQQQHELEPPRFVVRDVKKLQRDQTGVRMPQSASFSYSSLSRDFQKNSMEHVHSGIHHGIHEDMDTESGQRNTLVRRVSSGRRRAATVPNPPLNTLAPMTPARGGIDSRAIDHRYYFTPDVDDFINIAGSEDQDYHDSDVESARNQDPVSPLRGKTVIAPWTRRRSISDASEDAEAISGSFLGRSPLSQSVPVGGVLENTDDTPKKKKKSKNKLKDLLTISKSDQKIKKGSPIAERKKTYRQEETAENYPAVPRFVVNEVKLVQSASYDFSNFPQTANTEQPHNQAYTETVSFADMSENETSPTPSRSSTARRRALTLPPPLQDRLAVAAQRRGTDTNQTTRPAARFSFLPNTEDILSFPSGSTFSQSASINPNPQAVNPAARNYLAYDSDSASNFTDDDPVNYSESESEDNTTRCKCRTSGAHGLSNYDGPDQLELEAAIARRKMLELQIRENRRWCRMLRAQIQAGEVMERIAGMVYGVPDQKVDLLELLEANREMITVLVEQT